MAKQKVYIEESFVHEIEIECDNEDGIETGWMDIIIKEEK